MQISHFVWDCNSSEADFDYCLRTVIVASFCSSALTRASKELRLCGFKTFSGFASTSSATAAFTFASIWSDQGLP
jgi:hypothetical protein